MSKKFPLLGLPALALALTLSSLTSPAGAQSQSQTPAQQRAPEQQKDHAYVGQIVKAKDGRYALLINKGAGTGFYLDDQDKASRSRDKT
jgi:hypothetical protein